MKNVVIKRQTNNQRKDVTETNQSHCPHTDILGRQAKPTYKYNTKCTEHKRGTQTARENIQNNGGFNATLTKVTAPMLANVHVVTIKKQTPQML